MNCYEYVCDCITKQIIRDCPLEPTDLTQEEAPWLWATNNKYKEDAVDFSKVGKWMIFTNSTQVNNLWKRVKHGIQTGDLWHTKVSTIDPSKNKHVIIIYTKDFEDISNVVEVLDYLETSGIKPANKVIRYKTDQQTYAGIYATAGKRKASIYSSDRIKQTLLAK